MVSIPMLRAEIHIMAKQYRVNVYVSIPMLRAEIHSDSLMPHSPANSFNSHATRGNSLQRTNACRAVHLVSIPMLRAEIHLCDLVVLVLRDVSIPMLRAGIHRKIFRFVR